MNIQYDKVTVTLQNWNAAEYSDVFDQQKINFDERNHLVELCADGIRRREDQLIIDAVALSHFGTDAGDFTTELGTATFRATHLLLNKNNVPMDNKRTIAINAVGFDQLLGDEDADTFDKNTARILFEGEISKWLGFNIYMFGDMIEGGLPDTGDPSQQYAFAYHKAAVGLAVGINLRTEMNYRFATTSWLVNSIYVGNSITIDDNGVIRVKHLGT